MLPRLNKLSVILEEWAYVGTGIDTRGEIGQSREKTENILTGGKDNFKDTIGEHILHIVLDFFIIAEMKSSKESYNITKGSNSPISIAAEKF